MQRSGLRIVTGFFFGGFAGLSLTTAIFPMIMGHFFNLNGWYLLSAVQGFGIRLVLVSIAWAIGGAVIGWYGGVWAGGAILGGLGLLSGIILGIFVLQGDPAMVAASGLAGLLYGGVGGLILGKAFPKPLNDYTTQEKSG